ncbi:protein CREG2 [Discoglossus pictus]
MSVCSFHSKTSASAAWIVWLLWCNALLHAQGYVIVNSVSWSVTNEVEEELDSSSTEDALPALLEDTISMWKQSYPASAYKEDREMKSRRGPEGAKQISSPSRMFSYKRESSPGTDSSPPPTVDALQQQLAKNARILVQKSNMGFLASLAMVSGVPFGNILLTTDGPMNNSTGVPYFYVTPKANFVSDLLKNPAASLTFPNPDSDVCSVICRIYEELPVISPQDLYCDSSGGKFMLVQFPQEHIAVLSIFLERAFTEPEDPVCASLTLTGKMATVPPEQAGFAKKALFSRHPIMRKWSPNYNWLFMKINIEHIYITNCYGGIFNISLEDYYKVNPN